MSDAWVNIMEFGTKKIGRDSGLRNEFGSRHCLYSGYISAKSSLSRPPETSINNRPFAYITGNQLFTPCLFSVRGRRRRTLQPAQYVSHIIPHGALKSSADSADNPYPAPTSSQLSRHSHRLAHFQHGASDGRTPQSAHYVSHIPHEAQPGPGQSNQDRTAPYIYITSHITPGAVQPGSDCPVYIFRHSHHVTHTKPEAVQPRLDCPIYIICHSHHVTQSIVYSV